MAQVINAGLATPGDIRSLGVVPSGRDVLMNGKVVAKLSTPIEQQRYLADESIRSNRRSTEKQITINFTATSATNKLVVGNTLGLSADVTSNFTEVYQNPGKEASSSTSKAAFQAAVNSYPFRFVGMLMEVSSVAVFNSTTWTELINDYDVNNVQDFTPKIKLGINIFSQQPTTRLIPVVGEFNGFWGFKTSNLPDACTCNFTFYCVDIKRSW